MTMLTSAPTTEGIRDLLFDALDEHVEMLDRDVGHPADHRAAIANIATVGTALCHCTLMPEADYTVSTVTGSNHNCC